MRKMVCVLGVTLFSASVSVLNVVACQGGMHLCSTAPTSGTCVLLTIKSGSGKSLGGQASAGRGSSTDRGPHS